MAHTLQSNTLSPLLKLPTPALGLKHIIFLILDLLAGPQTDKTRRLAQCYGPAFLAAW